MSRYRGGAWNLRVGRDPQTVAKQVVRLLREQRLDFLLTCEQYQYVGAIERALVGTPWMLSAYPSAGRPARDSGVILRRTYPSSKRLHDLGGVEWERGKDRPGLHPPRKMVSDMVDGKFRVGSVHLPPTPRLDKFPLRDKAHRVALSKLHEIAGRWQVPFLLGGDWNMGPNVKGSKANPTPLWLANQIDAKIVGNRIDYVMGHGLDVSGYHRLDGYGGDHKPIIYVVTA